MRHAKRSSLATLGALALALGVPAAGSAATPVSLSFTTPGEQPWVVPPGVNSVQATAVGGNGGPGYGDVPGGSGGTVTATLAVSPGETLYAEVAGDGQGTNESADEEGRGGYGGGADGGERVVIFASGPGGGGGGGASDVRTCTANTADAECGGHSSLASRLLVAAGGGGGGGVGLPFSAAGDGGPADLPGYAGSNDSQGDEGGHGGTRGTHSAGGTAGAPSFDCAPSPPEGPGCAIAGQLGLGGEGGSAQGGGGGGGGGGLFGGGGGGGGWGSTTGSGTNLALFNAAGGGGGGGASGTPAGAPGASDFSLVPTAEGAQPSVTFTWTPSAPASVTGAPSALTATTAALDGTVNPSDWLVSSCAFALSPAPAGVAAFPCAQQLGAGSAPLPVSATAAGLAPSTTYTVTLLATSVQGTGSGSPVTFTTPASSATSVGDGSSAGGGSGGAGPAVSALKVSPTSFRRGRHAAVLASTRPKPKVTGTTISFQLSTAASVTLSFQRAVPGQLAGHSCVAPSSKRHRARRCTRYAPVGGAVTLAAHAGANRIHFEGVLGGGAALPPGNYRLAFTAGHTMAPQHPTFTLLV